MSTRLLLSGCTKNSSLRHFGTWMVGGIVATQVVCAGTFFVAPTGSDFNPGTEAAPWATVQHAVNAAQPGDTVIVNAGEYPERVNTARGGVGAENRITFQGQGTVIVRGWHINHPFITVRGFDITGHSGVSQVDPHVMIANDGDNAIFEGNKIRDGIHIVRHDVVIRKIDNEFGNLTTESGGLLAAGFKVGQTVLIGRAKRLDGPKNSGTGLVSSLSDTNMVLRMPLQDEGPTPIYLSASYMYGLMVGTGAENCLIRSNIFRNLSFDSCYIGGINNRVERNLLEATQGWDAMHYMGTNNVFSRNLIRNSPLVVFQVSPDAFENNAQVRYDNIVYEHNFVVGFDGVISSQKGATGDAGPLTYSRNVFVNTGSIDIRYPNASFLHNTFLNDSVLGNAVTAPLKHAIVFEAFNSVGAMLKNNVFVGCGGGRTPAQQGWYELLGGTNTAFLGGNFVAGPAPTFDAKTTFNEGNPSLNGGNPGFVNIDDPLGPDGLPFTDDDGLRPLPTSKLVAASDQGFDLGAYAPDPEPPVLEHVVVGGTLEFRWPRESVGYFLESAPTPDGPWTRVRTGAKAQGMLLTFNVGSVVSTSFYRLAQ